MVIVDFYKIFWVNESSSKLFQKCLLLKCKAVRKIYLLLHYTDKSLIKSRGKEKYVPEEKQFELIESQEDAIAKN